MAAWALRVGAFGKVNGKIGIITAIIPETPGDPENGVPPSPMAVRWIELDPATGLNKAGAKGAPDVPADKVTAPLAAELPASRQKSPERMAARGYL